MCVGHQKIRSRLLRCRGRYPIVSRLSGISVSWLYKFGRGTRGKRPSYDLILRLRAALDAIEDDPSKLRASKVLAKPRRKAAACRAPARTRGKDHVSR